MRVPMAAVLVSVSLCAACDSPTRPQDLGASPSIRKEFCYFDPCVVSIYEALSYVASVRITDLGALPGYTYSEANDVNDAGQIVGESWGGSSDPNTHATLWSSPTQMQALTLLGPPTAASSARGINASGMITGYSVNANGNQDGFLWNNGAVTDLTFANKSGGFYEIVGRRLNDAGTVVGDVTVGGLNGFQTIAYWPLGHTIASLNFIGPENTIGSDINSSDLMSGSILGMNNGPDSGFTVLTGQTVATKTCPTFGSGCRTFGVNDAGNTAGSLEYGSPLHNFHASFTDASVHDLGTLTPSFSQAASVALDLDESNLVVGSSYDSTSLGAGFEAFLWGADFGTVRLPVLPGGTILNTQALAINPHLLGDSVLVVGISPPAKSNGVHGVLWNVTVGLKPVFNFWPGVWGRPFTPIIYENPAYLTNSTPDRYIELRLAGAGNLDPSTIDLSTLQLNGTKPVYTAIKDLNGDGYQDLLALFSMEQLMQSGGLTARTIQLTVTGKLLKIGAPILVISPVTICLNARSCPTDDTVTGPT